MAGEERAERTSKLGVLAVRSRRNGGREVIELVGELDLDGAPRVEEALRSAESGDAASIVVDLRRLEFIDSTGIRLLIMAAARCADGRLTLLPGPRPVQRVFEIADLVDRLPFAD